PCLLNSDGFPVDPSGSPLGPTGSADARERDSALSKYSGVQSREVSLKPKQVYVSLADVPKVPMAAPIDFENVFSAASKVSALRDERFELLPKERHPLGKNKWSVHFGLEYRGVPLAQPSGKMLLLNAEGQPLVSRDRHIPQVLPRSTTPTVTQARAVELTMA